MIIGLTGAARSGKDTVAGILARKNGFERVGIADSIRELALEIDPYIRTEDPFPVFSRLSKFVERVGWEEAKDSADVRRLLQRIGKEGGRDFWGESVWWDRLKPKFGLHGRIVVSDVRFDDEAKNCDYVWLIKRPGTGPANGHDSENGVSLRLVNLTIHNKHSVDYLEGLVDAAYDWTRKRGHRTSDRKENNE